MMKSGQYLKQNQTQQQRLSPQQIQYIKLLQIPSFALDQRIQEELESNPVLEETDNEQIEGEWEENVEEHDRDVEPLDEVDDHEIDWDEYMNNTEYDGESNWTSYNEDRKSWRDLPNPYHESLLEDLEQQVALLDLNESEKLIADQIIGSIDNDGYFRRELDAIIDNLAFKHDKEVSKEDVERVLQQIQQLDPPGIASRDLQECLLIQLKDLPENTDGRDLAIRIIRDQWKHFEKKHFSKIKKKLNTDEENLKVAYRTIQGLDPKPGAVADVEEDTRNYIEPDFEVYYQPYEGEENDSEEEAGDFIIRLNNRNAPSLRISPRYKEMWDNLKNKKGKNSQDKQTKHFIKEKLESAQWFIESIRQRQNTMMNTMQTIVALQDQFFKYGEGLRPMILKDVAERVGLDISTISRVVNGKYVQTHFGVFELKYFFSEGIKMQDGKEVSSREVKNMLKDIINSEDKNNPLSDQALTDELKNRGFQVARRTVSKYREQQNIPVARLRKQVG